MRSLRRSVQRAARSEAVHELLPCASFLAQVSLEVSTAGALGLHSSLQLALDGTAMTVHRSPERRAPMSAPGCRTVLSAPDSSGGAGSSGASQALSSLRQYLGSLGSMRVQLESLCYRRVGLEFDREPAEGEPPGMALLRARQVGVLRSAASVLLACTLAMPELSIADAGGLPHARPSLQGLYCGSYGPHGQEVLRLAASTAAANAPPNCPISGPRLQALKLLGDPNVPALK